MNTLATLTNEAFEERFLLYGRMEIQQALNDLVHRREAVGLSFGEGRQGFLTALLSVGPSGIVFDIGGDAKTNTALLQAPSALISARPDGILIKCTVADIQRVSWGGSDAFFAPLPKRVLRLQRRDFFRITPPVVAESTAKLADAEGQSLGVYGVHDISVGGVGLTLEGHAPLAAGESVPFLSFQLPEVGLVTTTADVRHVTVLRDASANQVSRARVGLRFSGSDHHREVAIQRYIVHLEQQRRKLLAGGA